MTRHIRTALAHALVQSWQHKGLLNAVLLPLSGLLAALIALRKTLYRLGLLRSTRLPVPVMVVGNVIAGGAGKTPTVMAIAQYLKASGLRVGIASKGYGRNTRDTRLVQTDSSPQDVGDEPLLVHRSTLAPTVVSASRVEAIRALLKHDPGLDLVICDDGLQHYALYRDLEICVFDDRGTGNGWLLPAGPLREGWPRSTIAAAGVVLQTPLVLHTGSCPAFGGFRAYRTLASNAVNAAGEQLALEDLRATQSQPLLALAGIAQPQRFFAMLEAKGVHADRTLALEDHFAADTLPDLQSWQLVCTEKDAAKVWQRYPQAWAVPLVQSMEPSFWRAIDTQLGHCLRRPLSSGNGHSTDRPACMPCDQRAP
jgi:tetraacyldisaccharide 4'-kinase